MFQSLIGKLQTIYCWGASGSSGRFQSLIGKLQTHLEGEEVRFGDRGFNPL